MYQINNIKDLNRVDTTLLNSEDFFNFVNGLVLDKYYSYEPDEIKEALSAVKNLITIGDQDLKQTWSLKVKYLKLVDILEFGLINTTSDKQLTKLFNNSLVDLIKIEPDLKDRLITAVFLWGDYDGEKRKLLLNLITNNQAAIGVKRINELINDYDRYVGLKNRDALARLNYVNNLSKANKFSEVNKTWVNNLLDAYDWLKKGGPLPIELLIPDRKLEVGARLNNSTVPSPMKGEVNFNFSEVLNPSPLALKQPTPAFLFDESDELEIDQLRPKVEEILAQGNLVLEQELRELAEEVIKEHNFSFKDGVSKKRFVQVFVSFIKDVRGIIDVREVLLKSLENGGLGLTTDKTEAVIKILSQAKKDFDLGLKPKPQTKTSTELDKLIEGEAVNTNYLIKKPVLPKEPSPDKYRKPVVTAKTTEEVAAAEVARQAMLKELAAKAAWQKQADMVKQASDESKAKSQMSDIKAPPRVLGPLEELKTLTLEDFRRLAPQPQDVVHKLQSKIDLLGEKSVARRLEAIRSWQGSPVYRMYLALGRESIESNKHVELIIKEKLAAKMVTLSLEEFNAIADFNTKLRF